MNPSTRKIFIPLFLLIASPAYAGDYGDYDGAEYVRNYDGDTVTFNLPTLHPIIGDRVSIRIEGIDTPEIRGKCDQEKDLALRAKEMVGDILVRAWNIKLLRMGRGKYFRIVADIVADGESLKDALLEDGLAAEYDGGTKAKDWCGPG